MPPYVRVRVPVLDQDERHVGWLIWNDLAERVPVEGGYLPAEFHLDFAGAAHEPSAKVTFGVRDGAVFCSAVSLEAKTQGPEVKAKDLAAARSSLNEWMEMAALTALQDEDGRPVVLDDDDDRPRALAARRVAARSYNEARRRTRRKVTPELLQEVARLYRENISDGPWQVIQDRFGVAESTAARYVMLARKEKLLPETVSGKKKA